MMLGKGCVVETGAVVSRKLDPSTIAGAIRAQVLRAMFTGSNSEGVLLVKLWKGRNGHLTAHHATSCPIF